MKSKLPFEQLEIKHMGRNQPVDFNIIHGLWKIMRDLKEIIWKLKQLLLKKMVVSDPLFVVSRIKRFHSSITLK